MASLDNLHIHRWTKGKRANTIALAMAQSIAVHADMVHDVVLMLRRGRVDERLPQYPPAKQWLELYNDHERVFLAAADAMPEIIGTGDEVGAMLSEARAMSTMARVDPAKMQGELASIGPNELARTMELSWRLGRQMYRHHLAELQERMAGTAPEDTAADLGQELAESPALFFFIRVTLPCIVVHRRFPSQLLRKVRQGDARAVEALVRVDDLAAQHPLVEAWASRQPGRIRKSRQSQLRDWVSQGLNHGQFSRKQVKQSLAGLIAASVERTGQRVDLATGEVIPGEMNAREIYDLFNAVAWDQSGRATPVYDAHLKNDLETGALQKAIVRHKKLWRRIVPGGHKFM